MRYRKTDDVQYFAGYINGITAKDGIMKITANYWKTFLIGIKIGRIIGLKIKLVLEEPYSKRKRG